MAHLVLYDGVCGLCNRLNQFTLKRDSGDRFRFAALQSPIARELLQRYGREASDLNTVYVIVNYGAPDERLLSKGRAVLFVLRALGRIWSLARIFELLPSRFVDRLYDLVARRRYRWFGRFDACVVPQPRDRSKFLDDGAAPRK
jgi:predicted DCC family thiol-disulfide oxidoreductase YuxK